MPSVGNEALVLPGAAAFRLHDTFGFPIEITLEICRERGFGVDIQEFAWLMAEQKNRSRRDRGKDVVLVPGAADEWLEQNPQFSDLRSRIGEDGLVF